MWLVQADVLITIMAREKAVSLHEYKINKSDKKKELKLRERDGSQSNVYEKLNNESENNSNAKPIKSIKNTAENQHTHNKPSETIIAQNNVPDVKITPNSNTNFTDISNEDYKHINLNKNVKEALFKTFENNTFLKDDYSCDQCKFIAINHVGLNVHNTLYHCNQQRKETQPEETFTCNICEYKAGSSTGLDAHVMFSHS